MDKNEIERLLNCKILREAKYAIIDLFCGCGGMTCGFEKAEVDGRRLACVILGINHDRNAIESHKANHPETIHLVEDIRNVNLKKVSELVQKVRAKFPEIKIILHGSLECTNFSRAKGGGPRDADSRTLAEHLYERKLPTGEISTGYIQAVNPDRITIENVEEFMSWGSLDENGRPLSKDKGRCYILWRNKIKRMGYNFDYRMLNAADYGAYTSRKRYFGHFAKHGMEIIWPEPTHTKKPMKDLFTLNKEKWKPVKEVLDLKDTGDSIFVPGRIKSDKTFERIYHGLIKFVAGGKKEFEGFIVKWLSLSKDGSAKHCSLDINEPCCTVTTQNRLGLATLNFITTYYGNGGNSTVETVCPTLGTKDTGAVVTPFMMMDYTREPHVNSIENPSNALTQNPKSNLVTPFLMSNYTSGVNWSSLENPAGSIPTVPKTNIVSPQYFLMNPQWFNSSASSIDKPCFTLIARMDKAPPYLVEVEAGKLAIEIYETDSRFMILVKEFMALYGIIDIKMRMLKIPELLRIQGFPKHYILKGTQTEQKKYIGNSVCPIMAQKLIEANAG